MNRMFGHDFDGFICLSMYATAGLIVGSIIVTTIHLIFKI